MDAASAAQSHGRILLRFIDFVKAHPVLARLAIIAAGLVGEYLTRLISEALQDDDCPGDDKE